MVSFITTPKYSYKNITIFKNLNSKDGHFSPIQNNNSLNIIYTFYLQYRRVDHLTNGDSLLDTQLKFDCLQNVSQIIKITFNKNVLLTPWP
jgi:hypothetical protein